MDAAGGQLPPGEVADGRNEKQKRVCRGGVANKTKSAICPPLDAPHKQGDIQGGEAAMGRLRRIPRRAVLAERT